MDTRIKKKIEKLRHLLWLEKKEEDSFFSQYFRDFSQSKIEKAQKEGVCWYPLLFEKTVPDENEMIKVTFSLPKNREEEHSFQPGSSVKIFQVNLETGAIKHHAEGIINIIHKNRVEINYQSKRPLLWMEKETGIGILLSFNAFTYKVMEKALTDITEAKDNRLETLRDIMMGSQNASFSLREPFRSDWLNLSQQAAVNHILSSQDIALVHGPPGTGKTTTLVEAVIETLRTERQVMVCAYNNVAVDGLAEKLLTRGVSVVRIGNPAKVTDTLLNITYETKFSDHPFYADFLSCKAMIKKLKAEFSSTPFREIKTRREIKNKINEYNCYVAVLEMTIRTSIFKNSQVVAATMIGTSFYMLKDLTFSTVFIDEAAQALEPACWSPITKANRVIFAGDHYQLPPTIKSYEAAQTGLMHTLFEKIMERKPECSVMLTMQYRMHEKIMNFPSQWFYEKQLIASLSVRYKTLIDDDIPVEWVNTSQCDFRESRKSAGTSIYNYDEAHLIFLTLFDYMEKIGEERIKNEKITLGIISPYSAQVDLFRQKIKEYCYFEQFLDEKLISIRTIDGFQGQERDVITISLVRSNQHSNIGFLADYRRINVAMTRAKKKLILIGDASTLCEDPFFDALFSYIQKNGLVTELRETIK